MNNKFKPEDIDLFVKDHIQSKIVHNELGVDWFNMNDSELFKKEFEIYQNALFEGICNGIFMCGGNIEGIV